RPCRMLWRFCLTLVIVLAFLMLVAFVSNGWLPAAIFFGSLACVALAIVFAGLADSYLTKTFVLIGTDRAVVKTSLCGKETQREFTLKPQSRARLWYSRQRLPTGDQTW